MDKEVKAWLIDITNAIKEINDFLPDKKDFRTFQADLKTKRAVEIIGEAMNRILMRSPNIEITNSKRIVDTRNRVIHGYDSVSDDIIWAIVVRELPELAKEINQIL
ncbi:MAG: DUF86 domain-containing protein [Cyclobacteriaceae bacterium]|nr:DUF86 domain-containing protein [Cyclobacteriaceae bacterium HetDA_MAG_MS6]